MTEKLAMLITALFITFAFAGCVESGDASEEKIVEGDNKAVNNKESESATDTSNSGQSINQTEAVKCWEKHTSTPYETLPQDRVESEIEITDVQPGDRLKLKLSASSGSIALEGVITLTDPGGEEVWRESMGAVFGVTVTTRSTPWLSAQNGTWTVAISADTGVLVGSEIQDAHWIVGPSGCLVKG